MAKDTKTARRSAKTAELSPMDYYSKALKSGAISVRQSLAKLWDTNSGHPELEIEVEVLASKDGEKRYLNFEGAYLSPTNSMIYEEIQELDAGDTVSIVMQGQDPLELSDEELRAHDKNGTDISRWEDAMDNDQYRLAVIEIL